MPVAILAAVGALVWLVTNMVGTLITGPFMEAVMSMDGSPLWSRQLSALAIWASPGTALLGAGGVGGFLMKMKS